MGLGIWFLLVIIIFFICKYLFKENFKLTKNISKVLYVLVFIFISSILFSATVGISYSCPCGCGSTEYDLGILGIINFFNSRSYNIFSLDIIAYLFFVVRCFFVFCLVLLIVKILKNKKK